MLARPRQTHRRTRSSIDLEPQMQHIAPVDQSPELKPFACEFVSMRPDIYRMLKISGRMVKKKTVLVEKLQQQFHPEPLGLKFGRSSGHARRHTSELRKDSLFSIPECEREQQPLAKTFKKLPKQTVEPKRPSKKQPEPRPPSKPKHPTISTHRTSISLTTKRPFRSNSARKK